MPPTYPTPDLTPAEKRRIQRFNQSAENALDSKDQEEAAPYILDMEDYLELLTDSTFHVLIPAHLFKRDKNGVPETVARHLKLIKKVKETLRLTNYYVSTLPHEKQIPW